MGNFALNAPISIHTLRVEGDHVLLAVNRSYFISIHTLRVEGDSKKQQNCVAICIKIAIVKSVLYKKSF